MRLADLFSGNNQITAQNPPVQAGQPEPALRGPEQGVSSRLQSLTPGQVIRGELISADNGEVQIKLLNDLLMGAKVDQNILLEPGKIMSFQVRSNGKSLMLTPLQANLSVEGPVSKALDMAGLPINSATGEMTKRMMQAGLPIDRSSLQQMYREMVQQPAGQIADLVDLHKLGLPVTEENLTQMASYKNLTHQLAMGLADTSQALMETLSRMEEDGNSMEAAKLYGELVSLLEEPEAETENPKQETQAVSGRELFDEMVRELSEGEETTAAREQGALQAQEPQNEETVPTGREGRVILTETGGAELSQKETPGIRQEDAEQNVETPLRESRFAENDAERTVNPQENSRETVVFQNTVSAEKTKADPYENPERTVANPAREDVRAETPLGEPGVSEQIRQEAHRAPSLPTAAQYSRILTQVFRGTENSPKEQLELVDQLIRQGIETKDRNLTDALMRSPHVKKLLTDRFEKEWSITPEQVADRKEVEHLYGRLERQLTGVAKALESAGQSETPAFQAASNMNQNLDFLNQVNHMYSYVQLPLRLQQGKAQGDLYVYTNKKNLAAKDGPITALLHLDMEHLGPLDVYVSMQMQNVNTRFSVRDEEMLDFLEEHMDLLTRRLEKRGYRISVQTSLKSKEQEAETSGIAPILAQAAPGMLLQARGFDVRA